MGMNNNEKVEVRQSVRIGNSRLTMEQSFTVLGKKDLVQLERVPDVYLIDELSSRGYSIDGVVEGDRRTRLLTMAREMIAANLGTDVYREVEGLLTEAAMKDARGVQAVAADMLGVSRRTMNYRVNTQHGEKLLSAGNGGNNGNGDGGGGGDDGHDEGAG